MPQPFFAQLGSLPACRRLRSRAGRGPRSQPWPGRVRNLDAGPDDARAAAERRWPGARHRDQAPGAPLRWPRWAEARGPRAATATHPATPRRFATTHLRLSGTRQGPRRVGPGPARRGARTRLRGARRAPIRARRRARRPHRPRCRGTAEGRGTRAHETRGGASVSPRTTQGRLTDIRAAIDAIAAHRQEAHQVGLPQRRRCRGLAHRDRTPPPGTERDRE
jgi:hypothetical protein